MKNREFEAEKGKEARVEGRGIWNVDWHIDCLVTFMQSKFRTYEYAIQFARECRKLRSPIDLQEQLNRASASIALNLKEGSARHTEKDRHRFYRIALGSFRECEAIFDILGVNSKPLEELKNILGACLYRLCQKTNSQSLSDG